MNNGSWEKIDSAPKDGTRIWLWNGAMSSPVIGMWGPYYEPITGAVRHEWQLAFDAHETITPLLPGTFVHATMWRALERGPGCEQPPAVGPYEAAVRQAFSQVPEWLQRNPEAMCQYRGREVAVQFVMFLASEAKAGTGDDYAKPAYDKMVGTIFEIVQQQLTGEAGDTVLTAPPIPGIGGAPQVQP